MNHSTVADRRLCRTRSVRYDRWSPRVEIAVRGVYDALVILVLELALLSFQHSIVLDCLLDGVCHTPLSWSAVHPFGTAAPGVTFDTE
jgi:hypothetical protein